MIFLKQYILNDYITDDVRMVNPMMEINGFKVRPGFFDLNGALEFSCGVNFTVHTSNGTSCDLMLRLKKSGMRWMKQQSLALQIKIWEKC